MKLTVRYLGLMFEGGCYADTDTQVSPPVGAIRGHSGKVDVDQQPLAHPTRWGSMSTDLRSPSDVLLQALAHLRRQHSTDTLVQDDNAIRDTRFPIIADRDTILDPGVSIVLALDSNNVQSHLEGGISDPEIDKPWVGYPGVAYRRYEFCQWTLLSKKLHPMLIDAAVTALENVDRALTSGKLDGSIPVVSPYHGCDVRSRVLLIYSASSRDPPRCELREHLCQDIPA